MKTKIVTASQSGRSHPDNLKEVSLLAPFDNFQWMSQKQWLQKLHGKAVEFDGKIWPSYQSIADAYEMSVAGVKGMLKRSAQA